MAKVVIAEDTHYLQHLLERALTSQGHQCFYTPANREAVKLFSDQPKDILLLDLRLPDSHGKQLIQKIKDQFPRLPIIVVSAYVKEVGQVDLLRLGVERILKKPVKKEYLLEVVNTFVVPSRRVLIVGEAENQIKTLKSEIEKYGYQVDSLTELETLESQLIHRKLDAVVFWGDWATEVTVTGLCRNLRSKKEWVPVFFFTGRTDPDWTEQDLIAVSGEDLQTERLITHLAQHIGLQRNENSGHLRIVRLAGKIDREDILDFEIDWALTERKNLLFDLRQVTYLGPYIKKLLKEVPQRSRHLHLSTGMLISNEVQRSSVAEWLGQEAEEYQFFQDERQAVKEFQH